MDPREYELMYQVEDRHWWYRGMGIITRALLERWVPPGGNRILDAGCGTGAAMTSYLAERGRVTGIDLVPQALEFCRMRNARQLARASVLILPFAAACFDLVTSFDVLCERAVTDEKMALREFHRVLAPKGKVLLRLPAYGWLRGRHDERVHIKHRYTKEQVDGLLRESGFTVRHLSYANTVLFPLAAAKRLSEGIFPTGGAQSDLSINVGMLNGIFSSILAGEAFFVARYGLPFGLSVIAIGEK